MRVGICIDSACDLPPSFIEEHQLEILPINLLLGEQKEVLADTRNPDETIAFYKRYSEERNLVGSTQPFSVEQITRLVLDNLVKKYDRVMVITIASTRSLIYENATKASFAILSGYKQQRTQAGVEGSFALRVVDSKTLFTGEAVLVQEAVRLLKEENLPFDRLRTEVESRAKHVHAYLVPEDLHFVRQGGRAHGDRSVSWLSYTLGTALDIKPIIKAYRGETFPVRKIQGFEIAVNSLFDLARQQIDKGLLSKTICMSYAGDPNVVRRLAGYKLLEQHAAKHGVRLMLSVMSTTAGINVGPGAFSLAFMSDKLGEKD